MTKICTPIIRQFSTQTRNFTTSHFDAYHSDNNNQKEKEKERIKISEKLQEIQEKN